MDPDENETEGKLKENQRASKTPADQTQTPSPQKTPFFSLYRTGRDLQAGHFRVK